MTLDERKRAVRAEMKRLRADMPQKDKSAAETAVCLYLASCGALRSARTVAAYLSARCEICIDSWISAALASGKRVAVPRWNGGEYRMAALNGLNGRFLRSGPMGIREPVENAPGIQEDEIDVWILPGLAFSTSGARLGYGGGWYDRMLADARPDAVKIGVACRFQLLQEIPAGEGDVPVSAVVTPCGFSPAAP